MSLISFMLIYADIHIMVVHSTRRGEMFLISAGYEKNGFWLYTIVYYCVIFFFFFFCMHNLMDALLRTPSNYATPAVTSAGGCCFS